MVKPLLDGLDRARRLLRFCVSGDPMRSDRQIGLNCLDPPRRSGISKFSHLTSTEASVISPEGRDCRF